VVTIVSRIIGIAMGSFAGTTCGTCDRNFKFTALQ
jgi:hypothetical protein